MKYPRAETQDRKIIARQVLERIEENFLPYLADFALNKLREKWQVWRDIELANELNEEQQKILSGQICRNKAHNKALGYDSTRV